MTDKINNDEDDDNSYYSSKGFQKCEKLEDPLEEKWIVSFIKSNNLKKTYYRQFYAAGFYEAYDRVMTFMEKTNYQILWYKEKRKCNQYFKSMEILPLDYICTFCNKKYNNIEPIKCNFDNDLICTSEFCSINCRQEHLYYIHIKKMA